MSPILTQFRKLEPDWSPLTGSQVAGLLPGFFPQSNLLSLTGEQTQMYSADQFSPNFYMVVSLLLRFFSTSCIYIWNQVI